MTASEDKQELLGWIDRDQDLLIDFYLASSKRRAPIHRAIPRGDGTCAKNLGW